MSDRDECLRGHQAPTLSVGAQREEGSYFRNLEKDKIARRYEKDKSTPPRFGYRVKSEKFNWTDDDGQIGLSVNCADCAKTETCSICLHTQPERFMHVVRMDLETLSKELGMELVAQYDPQSDSGHENPCHFNILPTTARLDDLLMKLKVFLCEVFPKSMPRSPGEIAAAEQALVRYRQAFDLAMDVIPCSQHHTLTEVSVQSLLDPKTDG